MNIKLYFLTVLLLFHLCIFSLSISPSQPSNTFYIGTGIVDITGPASGLGMLGYGEANQITKGIHTRLYSRAFVIQDIESKEKTAIVTVDMGFLTTNIKKEVTTKLLSQNFTEENVMLIPSHTHSGPGGVTGLLVYDLTTWFFNHDNFQKIVNGIINSIKKAQDNLQLGSIALNKGNIDNCGINRSPTAFQQNPKQERTLFPNGVDREMTLLSFKSISGQDLGMINWFAVHGTSMPNTNTLISGDNKGYAAYLVEKHFHAKNSNTSTNYFYPDTEDQPFVAAFAPGIQGDISPNTNGPRCPDGSPCDVATSTCNGSNSGCKAQGPGSTPEESVRIIGNIQARGAIDIYNQASSWNYYHFSSHSQVSSILRWFDLGNLTIPQLNHFQQENNHDNNNNNNTKNQVSTCEAALGASFPGGTIDGPGPRLFKQGDLNPHWIKSVAGQFLCLRPFPPKKRTCHLPKPMLLDIRRGWNAVDHVLPFQVIRLGKLFLVGVPLEMTTVSGHRLKRQLTQYLKETFTLSNDDDIESYDIVIVTMANGYAQYVSTEEEYSTQRYESASTLFGPHTLSAITQIHKNLLFAISEKFSSSIIETRDENKLPKRNNLLKESIQPSPFHVNKQWSFFHNWAKFDAISSLINDLEPRVIQDVRQQYCLGETVRFQISSAHPSNSVFSSHPFMVIEKWQPDPRSDNQEGEWQPILHEGDWETKFIWNGGTKNTLEWKTEQHSGLFRMKHNAIVNPLFGSKKLVHVYSLQFYVEKC